MASRAIRGFLVVLYLSLSFAYNEGAESVGDLEIDLQLKILNKPYVKSIKTEEGDIFDCVDIYKQPAFDHPLLKNHSVQMKPSAFPKELVAAPTSSPHSHKSSGVGLSEACPLGTVPIRRTRKEELLWAKAFKKNSQSNAAAPPHSDKSSVVRGLSEACPLTNTAPIRRTRKEEIRAKAFKNNSDQSNAAAPPTGFHYATKILPGDPSKHYLGAAGLLNIQNPALTVNQFSQAFVQLRSGVDTLQFGWMVNPKLYGDNKTRTFASMAAGDYGCFNMLCTGFVQVNQEFPLGYVLRNISEYDGEQYYVRNAIFKDPKSGDWWLAHNDFEQTVGYWPKTLFSSLSSSAEEIQWGGGVHTDVIASSPFMGSGHFAEEGFREAAYIRNYQIIDESNQLQFPDENVLQYLTDSPHCYHICPLKGLDHAFLYGGPGGYCEKQLS